MYFMLLEIFSSCLVHAVPARNMLNKHEWVINTLGNSALGCRALQVWRNALLTEKVSREFTLEELIIDVDFLFLFLFSRISLSLTRF